MFDHLTVAYLGIEVPDPGPAADVLGGVVGLAAGAPTPGGARTWTNDRAVHRILVTEGPANDATVVGLEASDAGTFDRVAAQLAIAGWSPTEGTAAEVAERRVDRLVHVTAPWGTRIEVVTGLERTADEPELPGVSGGFLTGNLGFGHVVFATTAFDESDRFLIDGLGMARSDWLEMELAAGIELEVRFYHANPRHHSVALARAPFDLPQTLHHVMVELRERDDVGAAFDRAWTSGLPFANLLGVHDNDRMLSFYVTSPWGFAVEIGHGARTVGPDWDDDRRYDRISIWGHQPLSRP